MKTELVCPKKLPEPESQVDVFLPPFRSAEHEPRSLCGKVLLQLLAVFLSISCSIYHNESTL